MDTLKICSGCQKPLPPNAPDGLCPECLIKAGLDTGVDIDPDSRAQSGRTRFVAPTPDELAKQLPDLEILSFIGQGGMGAVYKARQKALDRVVALKILPPGVADAPSFAERFAREAKALAKLSHPGVVTLYEFGQADGLFYFLMEFVDGVNLRHLLEAGRLAPREALAIVPQICDALQYAHDQGIVHRDIKPENILLDRLGHVKVADFGLAKLVGAGDEPAAAGRVAAGSVMLTEVGKVMGTPPYMAPEQVEHPLQVDHRADIYSLGVVFYQMLTGELPSKRIEPPSRSIQMDVRIDEIVMRALEKTPQRRYQTAAELGAQVETVASPGSHPLVSTQSAAMKSNWIAFDVAVTCFFAGLILGILLLSVLPFASNRTSSSLLLVAVMAVLSPFAGIAVSRAFRRAMLSGNTEDVSYTADWLKALAAMAFVLAVPVVGFGIFFLFGMLTESGGWNPTTSEAVLVPLTWLGSLALPLAGWRLLQSGRSRGTTRSSGHLDNPSSRLLKVGKATITSSEQLATAAEQFFHAFRYKGQLLLDDRQLTFSGAGTHTVIPLAEIRDLSIGHHPRIMNPMGLDFISVTFDEGGQTKHSIITPVESLFGLPSHFNQVVADWFGAIRTAATAATGRSPGNTPASELGTPASSPVLVGVLVVLLTLALFGFAALRFGKKIQPPAYPIQTGAYPIPPPATGETNEGVENGENPRTTDFQQVLGYWEVVLVEGAGGRFMSLDSDSKPGDRLLIPHVQARSGDYKGLTGPGKPKQLVLNPKSAHYTHWLSEELRKTWSRNDSLHLYPEANPSPPDVKP